MPKTIAPTIHHYVVRVVVKENTSQKQNARSAFYLQTERFLKRAWKDSNLRHRV